MTQKTTKKDVAEDEITPVKTEIIPQHQTIVQVIDPAIAKRHDDNERIKRLNAEFKKKLAGEELVTYKPPKYFADVLSPTYVINLNGYDIVVRFDGTPQKFPATIYKYLMNKLSRVMDSNAQGGQIDEL